MMPVFRLKQFVFSALIFVNVAFANAAPFEHALPEFSAFYAVQKFDIKLATAHYKLQHTKNGYRISQHTELYGMAAMFRSDTVDASSLVEQVNGKLRLKQFDYTQTGKEKNRNENLTFTYASSSKGLSTTISGTSRSQPVSIRTPKTVWDILSFQIPLMIDASADKNSYPYIAVINGEVDQYVFELKDKKNYNFAGNQYQLLNMVRSDTKKNRALHIWLAPALHNLPVIIENYRDGKLHSRMQLERVQFDQQPVLQELAEIDFDD